MEWYTAVIAFLSLAAIGFLVVNVVLIGIVEDLKIENCKLKIDLRHK